MIIKVSLVLVAEVCWGIPAAHGALGAGRSPGHEPAMGGGLWPHKQHKALQDPVNNEETPDQNPPLHQGAHEETEEANRV